MPSLMMRGLIRVLLVMAVSIITARLILLT